MKGQKLDQLLLRGGLVLTGALCWRAASVLWHAGLTPMSGVATGVMLGGYLLGFALLAAAAMPPERRFVRHLIPVGLSLVVSAWVLVHLVNQSAGGHPSTTDALIYSDYAARLLLDGINPYTSDLSSAYRLHRLPMFFLTSLVDGDFTGRAAYPALSFLVFVPLVAGGVPTEWLYPACLGAALVLIYLWSPRRFQPVVLLPFFADQTLFVYALGGVTDTVWVLLLVIAIRYWDRPVVRAVLFGLACAYKHQPWVLAPYLLIRVWHEAQGGRVTKLRAGALFVGVCAGTFLLVNVPFIAWDPVAWFHGVTEPARAAMVTYGQGLSTLAMTGVARVPKSVFTAFRLVLWCVTLVVYWRQFRRLRELCWLMPAFVLWFGHRSLTSYWYFNLIPFVFALVWTARNGPSAPAVRPPPRWRWDLAATAVAVCAVVVATVVFAWRTPQLGLRVVGAVDTKGANGFAMTVAVDNHGSAPIEPRFTVQSLGTQPFYWGIRSGPQGPLEPGATATYRIERPAPFAGFSVLRGARLSVIDAGDGDRSLTVVVPGDGSYVEPDRVPNGDFRFWERGAPTFWGFVDECQTGGRLRLVEPEGPAGPAAAVRLELPPAGEKRCAYLDTVLVLPDRPVRAWVKRPRATSSSAAQRLAYGLRLVLEDHILWILFGEAEAQGEHSPHERYVVVPSPVDTWQRHDLDLPALLARAGIDAPAWRTRLPRFEHLDGPVVAVNLQLAARVGPGTEPAVVDFGPIHVPDDPVLARRFRRDLVRPEEHQFWRGEYELAARNHEKAIAHFRRGLAFAPSAGRAHFNLAEAAFWSHDWMAAAAHYLRAAELGYRVGSAHKGRGWVEYERRRFGEALKSWQEALAHYRISDDPAAVVHAADCLSGMATTYVKTGHCDEAVVLLVEGWLDFPGVELPLGTVASCDGAAELRDMARGGASRR